MADSYVCSGAMMRCTMGTSPATLTVLPTRTVYLAGQPQANISDHKSMVNLAPFGLCRSLGFPATASATAAAHGVLTPMPCVHNTQAPWMGGKMDTLIKGQPALLKSSKCQCMWGGTISLINNGQVGQGAEGVDKSFLDSVSDVINRSREWWRHRQYIKKINKQKYEYKPEVVDVELANTLRERLSNANVIQELTNRGTVEERADYVENTLVPLLINTMDLNENLTFNWYSGKSTECGYYYEGDQSLNINVNRYLVTTDESIIKEFINTIIHECKHARQYDEVAGRKSHGYSDELKKKWEENFYNYISSEESDEGYMKQPVELDAWEFADSIIPDELLENFKLKHQI